MWKELTAFHLSDNADLFDLIPRTTAEAPRPNFQNMTREEYFKYDRDNGHCSALIKLTGDFSELFFGHSSWFRYQAMLRIMKNCERQREPSGGVTC